MNRSMYFGKPSSWTKLQGQAELFKAKALNSQIEFHNKAITRVKDALGKKCKFLAHYTEGPTQGFKAILVINNKPKTIHVLKGVPEFDALKAVDYKNLNDTLNGYVRGKENIRKS